MFTVLSGFKVNAGDQLIEVRGLSLLRRVWSSEKILRLNRWERLDGDLDAINSSRALILLGGPALVENLYPGIYPLVPDLDDIKVPIVGMGLGSHLKPLSKRALGAFRFSPSSRPLLDRLASDHAMFSVREIIAKQILELNGVHNAVVTGCPALYHPGWSGALALPKRIEQLAFAPGTGHLNRTGSRKKILRQQLEILRMLRQLFPRARHSCVFQDSLVSDQYKSAFRRARQIEFVARAEECGCEIIDCTGDVNIMLDTYERTDLLISFRVHSHLSMISQGKPSVLVAEDSRGYGMNQFVNLPTFDGYVPEGQGIVDTKRLPELVAKAKRLFLPPRPNPLLVMELQVFLQEELTNGFGSFVGLAETLSMRFKIMERFLKSLP